MGARFSAPVETGPWAHPASCTMGTGSFLGVKSGRGVTLTPHPLLVPWSRKCRAIPLLPPMGLRLVQNHSAGTSGHFTIFYFFCHQVPLCSYLLSPSSQFYCPRFVFFSMANLKANETVSNVNMDIYIYTHTYMYVCVCVCVCGCSFSKPIRKLSKTLWT